jgi:SAM-dependent methyltransferase
MSIITEWCRMTALAGAPFSTRGFLKAMIKVRAKRSLRQIMPYALLQKIGLFKHGVNDQPAEALRKFSQHFAAVKPYLSKSEGWRCVEIGPGDSLATGLCGLLAGAAHVYSVDVGAFASRSPNLYADVRDCAVKSGLAIADRQSDRTLPQLLDSLFESYLQNGVESLAQIPSESIDFIFSTVALEHIADKDLNRFFAESARILKAGGVCSHGIDFRDHVSGGLQHLRNRSLRQPLGLGYINSRGPAFFVRGFEQHGLNCTITAASAWRMQDIAKGRAHTEEHALNGWLLAECDLVAEKVAQ